MGSTIKLDEKGEAVLLPLDICNIPLELKNTAQWVYWRPVKDASGKWKKIPFNPNDIQNYANINLSSTWSDFPTAQREVANYSAGGIGFVLTSKDNFVGIDLDDCVDVSTGKVEDWAQLIIDNLNSYTERSPTGYGIRIFIKGTLGDQTGMHRGKIEIYDKGRFLTVTGNYLPQYGNLIEDRQEQLNQLVLKLNSVNKTQQLKKASNKVMSDANIELVLEKAFRSQNGQKIKDLWSGSWSEWYPSQSEADLALCNYLVYWVSRDTKELNALFEKSGLYRNKWHERHGNRTYGEITIDNALLNVNESYKESKQDGWDDPLPYEAGTTPQFPIDSLPAVIRNYISDASFRIGSPVDYCAVAALVASAALIGKNVYIKPKRNDSWTERACLWGIVVGNPGTKKSPAIKEIMKFVEELQNKRSDQFNKQIADWNKKDDHVKMLKKSMIKNNKNILKKI